MHRFLAIVTLSTVLIISWKPLVSVMTMSFLCCRIMLNRIPCSRNHLGEKKKAFFKWKQWQGSLKYSGDPRILVTSRDAARMKFSKFSESICGNSQNLSPSVNIWFMDRSSKRDKNCENGYESPCLVEDIIGRLLLSSKCKPVMVPAGAAIPHAVAIPLASLYFVRT